jgi:pyocin activator protein PrtN
MSKARGIEFGSTLFFLMGQYGSRAVIPADEVRRDYFGHLSLVKFLRKCDEGDIPLTIIRVERSQKGASGIHIQDLANYIDAQRAKAKGLDSQGGPAA